MNDSRLESYRNDDAFVGALLGLAIGPIIGAFFGAIAGLALYGSFWPAAGMGAMPIGSLGGPLVGGVLGAISLYRKKRQR